MLIMLTNRCHMECPHCMQEATPDGPHMTEETFLQVLDLCREVKPPLISVTGGEPTEHPRWSEYVRRLLALKSVKVLSILTNGAWIEDKADRLAMARFVREGRGRVKVQVYSNPRYYQDHEWTVEHEQAYRSIGCTPDFTSPIFMQDLGRARQNCSEEVTANRFSPSCVNSHLIAVQSASLGQFLMRSVMAGKFCRPLIDPLGGIHMSESWHCPQVAHVSDGAALVFSKMQRARPCRRCRLWKNFKKYHSIEATMLDM